MPSQETASKPQKQFIEVIALRPFGRELTEKEKAETLASLKKRKKEENIEGLTIMVQPGERASIDMEAAKKLQKAQAIEIVL